ncbi:MAG: alanine/glycine:cation symporter family protein [Cyclobacteriaceae bacterium]
MKRQPKLITAVLTMLLSYFPSISHAGTVDDKINKFFQEWITDPVMRTVFVSFRYDVGGEEIKLPIVLVWLIAGAIFFTIYFKFINFKAFKLAFNIVRGKYSDPNDKGEVSHFQALTAALSGTVGLGNIAGVAVAISLGGPGATLWMIVAGFLGMSSKFVECTLGVKYRQINSKGKVYGGPMYYLAEGFSKIKVSIAGQEKDYSKMGKVLAVIFAIACVGGSFGGGNMFQSNQAFKQFSHLSFVQDTWLYDNGWCFGLIMAAIVGVVIVGGIKSIAKVTDKIVPFMVGVYLLAALAVIFSNLSGLPNAFVLIFNGAFSPTAISGGILGVMIQGFKRSAFSNEAGIGSASIAHSAVKTNDPASEGIVALLEPFIDTVIICTITALVLIITGEYQNTQGISGVAMTSAAFGSVFSWFPAVLTVAVVLFAFSTMISWSYYGMQAWSYLFGKSGIAEAIYKTLFCLFVVLGAASELGPVIDFSDAMIFLMCFPNIFGMVFLAPVVKQELANYLKKIKA